MIGAVLCRSGLLFPDCPLHARVASVRAYDYRGQTTVPQTQTISSSAMPRGSGTRENPEDTEVNVVDESLMNAGPSACSQCALPSRPHFEHLSLSSKRSVALMLGASSCCRGLSVRLAPSELRRRYLVGILVHGQVAGPNPNFQTGEATGSKRVAMQARLGLLAPWAAHVVDDCRTHQHHSDG